MLMEGGILYPATVTIPNRSELAEKAPRGAAVLEKQRVIWLPDSFGASVVSIIAAIGCAAIGMTVRREEMRQSLSRVGLFRAGDEFGRALGDNAAAAFAAFRSLVNDPVGLFYDGPRKLRD